jgi:choline dehydrogenase
LGNRKLYLPRGKTLGGCSATNAMAYVRGNHADYDYWESLGNRGWGYHDILNYFKKSEQAFHSSSLETDYHGKQGELHVSMADGFETPFSVAFIEAAMEMGFRVNADYNGKSQNGFAKFQFTIKNGKRHGAKEAFLNPARSRKNLTIQPGSTASKILVKNDKAAGVLVNVKGTQVEFLARKEVIISAGAFGSPQLLMLSGIGSKTELNEFNIPIVKELEGVGKNLQDHLFFPVSSLSKTQQGLNHFGTISGQIKAFMDFAMNKKGPFTIGPLEAVGFLDIHQKSELPNFQFHFAPLHIGRNYDFDMYDINKIPKNEDGFTILPSLLQPKSRGVVKLGSRNPAQAPIIDPDFLSKDDDLSTLVKGGKLAIEMLHQKAFTNHLKEIIMPANIHDEEFLRMHIIKSVETIYHPVGTCKMGSDELAVVDDQLRVHGIEGLRVVDASIMPKIVTGNTNAPVYMIAEKAADMILSG